jgi:hypothetical protein
MIELSVTVVLVKHRGQRLLASFGRGHQYFETAVVTRFEVLGPTDDVVVTPTMCVVASTVRVAFVPPMMDDHVPSLWEIGTRDDDGRRSVRSNVAGLFVERDPRRFWDVFRCRESATGDREQSAPEQAHGSASCKFVHRQFTSPRRI